MAGWADFFTFLRCINCGGGLNHTAPSTLYGHYPGVTGELTCASCGGGYPLFHDIPVMFGDAARIRLLIDGNAYRSRCEEAMDRMKEASQFSGAQLEQFRESGKNDVDAIGWEILFWEKWKEIDRDTGFLDSDRDKIDRFLIEDTEGGGRLRFFERVLSFCNGPIKGRRLLNIGAGRDFLLERFLDIGCGVVEQDIVLEPLYFLKKRGASFCICCDARQLPFRDDTFDITTSFGTLHHIWPIEGPVAELLRVTSGAISLNEPNFFALTRAALLFPDVIKRRLKRFYSGDYSHSPYEAVINPYAFKNIVKSFHGHIRDLSFPRSSWIAKGGRGLKRLLRAVNLCVTAVIPPTSSHFDAVIEKVKSNLNNSD
ncbi:MAG: class I SAM-dependent methyltransferase [Candidatus Omnitrophica bacterium]|nr:class I SAM-dependent methyltransferase [Candidatus Omnitrophota bacterium]